MKKIILIPLFLLVLSVFGQNEKLKPHFDERVELMSIVFRLSEAREYNNNTVKIYTDKIKEHFSSYRKHPVVSLAKKVRKKNGVAYDAVMSMAIHLQIVDGEISMENDLAENSLDNRWGKYTNRFIKQLNDFYQKTNFNRFYLSQTKLYEKAQKRYAKISNQLDLEWYEMFYGQKADANYNLIICLGNYGNYGPKVNYISGKEDIYSIVSAYQIDDAGEPVFKQSQFSTLVHEYAHSYCNPLGEKYYDKFEPKAQEVFLSVKKKLKRMAYGSSLTMINESLVRASTIKYLADHGLEQKKIEKKLYTEYIKGFIWIEELYEAICAYDSKRKQFKSLDEYMMNIVDVFSAIETEKQVHKYDYLQPSIISISIENGSVISADMKRIQVIYDKSMSSCKLRNNSGEKKLLPKNKVSWENDQHKILNIDVELERNKTYKITFASEYNRSSLGFPLKEKKEIVFSTN